MKGKRKFFCKRFSKKGFTLVELSFSILFISMLSLAVALLIIDAVTSYRRVIILNEINTVGMELADEIRASIQNAPAGSFEDDAVVSYSKEDGEGKVAFGVFCTGKYSYIWNSGYALGDNDKALKYEGPFKLLKIPDIDRNVCDEEKLELESGKDLTENKFGYNSLSEDPVDVLGGNNSLALYDLSSVVVGNNAGVNSMLYSASFILGTIQDGIDIKATGNYCKAPDGYSDYSSALDYCAINKFNFVARANGIN